MGKGILGGIVSFAVLFVVMNNITGALARALGITGAGENAMFSGGIAIALVLAALIARKLAGRDKR